MKYVRRLLRVVSWCVLLLAAVPATARTPWTTSRVVGSPDPPRPYHVERVYPQLEFDQPVELAPLADTDRMMLLEVTGKLYTFVDDPASASADLALDLGPLVDKFHRAYGFAIHPNFASNRQVFVAYAENIAGRSDGTRLSRFTMSDDETPRIDPGSEEILLTWPSGGHNGCAIRFDSDGYLYFSAGDGARPFPPDEYDVSQDLSDLRSSICRIDVDRRGKDLPYAIPEDNPFVDLDGARPEIWAFGFRNPWRFTIAPETNQILCGDVGWELWELVFDVKRGGNYGWSIFEGPQPIRSDLSPGPSPISKPIVAYSHAVGQSITGGHIYRGIEHQDLRGAYLYGDYVTGLLWGLRHDGSEISWNPVLAETGLAIITFAESHDHEVLVVGYNGQIYKLVKNEASVQPSTFPRKLSETGLFEEMTRLQPSAGVFEYQPIATAYEDGAQSTFVVGIPGSDKIRIARKQRAWRFPEGTVFAKTLTMDGQRLETQLLHFDGINWHPYSYQWTDDQIDAVLVDDGGAVIEIGHDADAGSGHAKDARPGQWVIPNRAQCRACHSRQNGGAIAFSFENLGDDQVGRFVADGILDRRPPAGWNVSQMVDPHDAKQVLDSRARSYLAANCAHCHQRGGGGTVPMNLAYSSTPEEFNAIDVPPSQGAFGMDDARVISPGDPARSVLFYRMATSGTGHMPKVWTRDNDAAGLRLVHDWIGSMGLDRSAQKTSLSGTPSTVSQSLRQFAELLASDTDATELANQARAISTEAPPVSAALFERFLPRGERRKRLGNDIDRDAILAMTGNAERGRARFFDDASQQCNLCHRLEGRGRSVGPDLDGIAGKRKREELLESIIDPSKQIDPKYTAQLVLTDDGQSVHGLLVEESPERLVIRSADGKDHPIIRDHIESQRRQSESLMPQGMVAEMTADELADLLAFLASLK